ncbi:MAG: cation transporter [Nitrospinaceae bacterium]|jgi:cobalt-zinc-cadmium efflux system protein|nr:MAG: cation transporter [Nitrospinaceae bacterium]
MNSPAVRKRLTLSIVLTFFVLLLEAAGGVISGSLALLSDAGHMFGDVFSLTLSWFALRIASQPVTSTRTYGYHRMEIFAAFLNGVLLILMAGVIFYEAVLRFQAPSEVDSATLVIVAAIGLATNLGVIFFLKDAAGHSHDLNVKSAFLHVIGDTLASVGVIVGGVIMWNTGWYLIDPLIAAAIALLLLWGGWRVLADSVHILLEGVPKGISLGEVERELTAIPAIQNVHELHIWSICSNIYALSTHALVNDQKVNQVESILNEARDLLKNKFNITHSTIQFESRPCQDSEAQCNMEH